MKPEEKAEIILWDWLKTRSSHVQEIFFNRKNELNAPRFKTTGMNKKPDFLIKIDRGYGIEYIALEIKFATSSRSVLDSGKILDYYENYYLGDTQYLINNQKVDIHHFAVATQNSPKGHLFNFERSIENGWISNDAWRQFNIKYKLEPQYEYSETSKFQRNLWNQFKRLRSKLDITQGPSIGMIHSEISEVGSTENTPHLFIMNFNKHLKKAKWGARFWKL